MPLPPGHVVAVVAVVTIAAGVAALTTITQRRFRTVARSLIRVPRGFAAVETNHRPLTAPYSESASAPPAGAPLPAMSPPISPSSPSPISPMSPDGPPLIPVDSCCSTLLA